MKTIDDLKALLPLLLELFAKNDHEIGESFWEQDEDGWAKCDEGESNCFIYEKDGWYFEVNYECCGEYRTDDGDSWTPPSCELVRAWGEVTEIFASYYDKRTEEEIEFTKQEMAEFFTPFNEQLKNIA